MEDKVTITLDEYETLKGDSEFLRKLQRYGVDNWNGYDLACEDD